jgi:YD repeat-containing protein
MGRLTAIALAILSATVLVTASAAAPVELGGTICQIDFRAPVANLDCIVAVPGGAVTLGGVFSVVERVAGGPSRFTYDAAGGLVRVDAADGSHSYSFDDGGRLLMRVDSSGQTIRYAYDELGRLTSAGTAQLAYSGDQLSRVAADGTTTEYSYDGNGNLVSATDSSGEAVRFTYDPHRQVVGSATESGTITYTYDRQGKPVSRTSLASTTSFDYGRRGDLVRSIDSSGETITYAYDRDGSLVQRTSRNGTATFAYGSGGRITTATAPDGSGTDLAYDALGHVATVVPEAGDEVLVSFENGDTQSPVVIGFLWPDHDSLTLNTQGRLMACARCP